jgi:phosphoribosylanthranilate isomerase
MTEIPLIKICGMTRPRDAVLAAELGASFIGMIFYPGSKRRIDIDSAKKITAGLRGSKVKKVAVFVDPSMEDILKVRDEVDIDLIQLHGDESPEFCSSLPLPVIKSFCVGTAIDEKSLETYKERIGYFLFDTRDQVQKGGTGRIFDWSLLEPWRQTHPDRKVFLAGGLSPENICRAAASHPFGLDVNSGVESVPGLKDRELMKRLFEEIYAS